MRKEEILSLFSDRSSVRLYDTERKITREDLELILNAAVLSPSSVGFEPWKFVVVENRDILESLKHLGFGIKRQFETASAVVFLFCLEDPSFNNPKIVKHLLEVKNHTREVLPKLESRYRSFFENDMKIWDNPRAMYDWASKQTYIALANMMTAAQGLGVQSCPIEGFNYESMNKALHDLEIIDDKDYKISVILSLGYESEPNGSNKTRRHFEDVVRWL